MYIPPMENIWGKICRILAEKLPDAQYKVWIAPLSGKLENDSLVVAAMNDFVAKFVRNRFSADIARVAEEVAGRKLAVEIRTVSLPVAAELSSFPAGPASSTGESSSLCNELCAGGAFQPAAHESVLSGLRGNDAGTGLNARPLPDGPVLSAQGYGQPGGNGFLPVNGEASLVSGGPAVSDGDTSQQQASLPMRWPENRGSARLARNWRYSFDDFIVGPCNELAHAAARGICKPGHCGYGSSDVLFLCSAPGLGKTHLMHAVGAGLIRASNFNAPRVEYLSAEEFATQMRYALRNGDIDRFKARYREADVLLLEDIHFLQDKEKTQNEVLATLSALMEKGSRVVLTSSFALPELKKLDSQLFSRLSSGLVAAIERPDTETRRRIISYKAVSGHIALSNDVTDYLAENINSDVRQIESCLRNLALKASLLNRAINMEMAREAVSNYLGLDRVLTIESIVRLVCEGFGISTDALNSKSRKHECVQARNAAFYLARKHTELSLQEIGKRFNRTHSTVIKGITTLEREMSRESTAGRQLANAISTIERTGLRA